ncbi:Arylsulfatase [Allorhodopirellula solitaria]|uniref:Arylsulfatase n=1 Tax=Allorhodopirellula solitaria TaxID=2527987 RepID=A0A5C5X1C2_9BACT|nr:Arylsulfatase [Allorhodopirellula solitaria]
MNSRFCFCVLMIAITVSVFRSAEAESQPPNLLILLADDMGYGDLGCTHSDHLRTPNIDALAESGVICSAAYVTSSVCSPSRAGLMTGRDPRRFGYESNLNQSASGYGTRPELLGLAPTEHTIGDQLHSAGYETALVGKWHLGGGPGFHPNRRGFDYFCGMIVGHHDYFPDPQKNKLERNGAPLEEFSSPYLTDFFTDEGIDWIQQREGEEGTQRKPWMLMMSYNAPHTPMQAREDDLARFEHIENPRRRTYAAMVWALDRGIGRIVEHLKSTGQYENTLVVFFSDNGGATNNASWNGPYSGAKGSLREGGVRIPMIWSWPGHLPSESTHRGVVSSLDVLPTFMAAAGQELLPLNDPPSHEDARNRRRGIRQYGAYDGINLLPQLAGEQPAAHRTLFWRLQGQTAVRDGEDKLISLSHRPAEMFQVDVDAAEADDLSRESPERFEELYRKLGEWEVSLPTVPLWGSSPFWSGESAGIYDSWQPRPEPE